MAIYDRVPCKSLHLTKFNRSHTSSFTGDMSVVYPTLVDEAIPGDVTKLGHEQVTKFMPLVSPILDDIYIDHWSMFVPNRLIYADWERFIERKSGTNNDYDKPLMSIQQIWKAWKTWQSAHTSEVAGLGLDVKSMFGNIAGLATSAKIKVGTTVYDSPTDYAHAIVSAHGVPTSESDVRRVTDSLSKAIALWMNSHPEVVSSCTEYYVYPFATGSLMDYLGFPVLDVSLQDFKLLYTVSVGSGSVKNQLTVQSVSACALDWDSDVTFNGKNYSYNDWCDFVDAWSENEYWSATPYLSYWYCYNEWFRHQEFDLKNYCLVKHIPANVSAPDISYLGVPEEDVDNPDSPEDVTLRWYPFTRVVNRDYFTSSLPTAQRGTAPALPISGLLPVTKFKSVSDVASIKGNMVDGVNIYLGDGSNGLDILSKDYMVSGTPVGGVNVNPMGIDLASATTFDINDLRLANAIQRFQELNNVAGSRYTSFLKVQYGTAPSDDVLQRPDYFAHSSEMVHTQEVENFADNGVSPLGARAGKASSSGSGFARPYHPREHGVIINFVCVSPKQSYTSQGVERCWLRKSSFDYYNSLFAGLGEQEILKEELYYGGDSHDHEILGFNGRFDEYRVKQSNLKGLLRSSKYVSYGLSRRFFNAPSLNSDFLHYNIDKSRFLAVPSEPTFVMFYRNLLTQYRPMPEFATPSL